MLSLMTGPAAAGTITPVTVTGGDDGIPPDLLLQSETYISAETNARFKTAKPNKADFVVEEGKEVDLATPVSVESKSKMEVQMTKSVAETVTPVHKVNRSVEVNVKRPSWLSEDWKFERKFCTNGSSAGTIDNYYYEPVSGKKFRSMPEVLRFLKTGSMRKKSTGGNATVILSLVRATEAVTNACIGVGCLYCTILGVAHEV
ncbi:Methyl-CpG-binding domain-containing protein 5 [Capsicum annuum]|nr:Methyl-CpG-binding domain-containing protein 5 [Capsicum annuum]